MPDILNDSKPVSLKALHKILEQSNSKQILDKFSFPIAILDDDNELAFYVCNDSVMREIATESQTILALLNNVLQIPKPQDLILRLAAYQELFINHRKEYFSIFNGLKEKEEIDIEEFIEKLGLNNESEN